MLMKKRWMQKGLLLLLCLFLLAGCAGSEELERHVYTEEEVEAFIRYDGANACIPAGLEDIMDHRMALATLVMEGTVLDDGTEVEFLPDGKYLKTPADMTLFQVRVEEIWFGKADGKTITVGYAGKHDERVSKPQKGDRVILFLKKSLVGDYYGMTGRMEQTYILNPPDDRLIALYTSRGRDKWPTFSKEDVRQEMEECLQRFVDGTTEYRYENKVLKHYIDSCRRKEKLQSMLPWNWE